MLAALDAHLACLTALRADLASARPTRPGARWYAAAASVVAARRYADVLSGALGDTGRDRSPAAGDDT